MVKNPALDQLRRDLTSVVTAGLARADAGRLVRAALDPAPEPLAASRAVWVVAAGKVAAPMAVVFGTWAGDRVRGGVVVGPAGTMPAAIGRLDLIAASHPDPDARSAEGGRRALEVAAQAAQAGDLLVVLLSGGASSLMALPAPGLSLEELANAARQLMKAGAPIDELNTVRKHLSAVTGGRLAAAAGASLTLAISDVVAPVSDDPSVIGSGPTVADPTTFTNALHIIDRLRLGKTVPAAVVEALKKGARGEWEETIKPDDPRLARATFQLIGSRRDALAGARAAAEALGYRVFEVAEPLVGEAAPAGGLLMDAAALHQTGCTGRYCVLAAGETTVVLTGSGKGGRNQELVLGAAARGGLSRPFALTSVGTDGIDGPTDAAGATADSVTLERAAAAGLAPPRSFLDRNDAYGFFESLDDLVKIGPTSTNVGDLQVVLLAGAE